MTEHDTTADLDRAREAIRAWAHYVYHDGDYPDCWCHPIQGGGPRE